jgi:hypothetical protein
MRTQLYALSLKTFVLTAVFHVPEAHPEIHEIPPCPPLAKGGWGGFSEQRNESQLQGVTEIQSEDSRVKILVIPTDEELEIARFRLPVWMIAVSSQEATCQQLQFSSGVYPVCEAEHPENWTAYVSTWLKTHGMEGKIALVTEGPSRKHPDVNNRLEIVGVAYQGEGDR